MTPPSRRTPSADVLAARADAPATIQIRSQLLRRMPSAPGSAVLAFPQMADHAATEKCMGEGRRKALWREADVRRAISVAEEAGLLAYRVEIAPDGTISIVVGASCDLADAPPADDLHCP